MLLKPEITARLMGHLLLRIQALPFFTFKKREWKAKDHISYWFTQPLKIMEIHTISIDEKKSKKIIFSYQLMKTGELKTVVIFCSS